tara:strand:- start:2814 stop:2966 length:153 start_codon:yes stop_codon:yes gene_type:complete
MQRKPLEFKEIEKNKYKVTSDNNIGERTSVILTKKEALELAWFFIGEIKL